VHREERAAGDQAVLPAGTLMVAAPGSAPSASRYGVTVGRVAARRIRDQTGWANASGSTLSTRPASPASSASSWV
jgi:hypothetical protein